MKSSAVNKRSAMHKLLTKLKEKCFTILLYCTVRELTRVIGKEKMLRLFFGPTALPAF
jgi:hypothetical protein